jgi:cystathionine beta-lyase/cystathionine gamma-synthase
MDDIPCSPPRPLARATRLAQLQQVVVGAGLARPLARATRLAQAGTRSDAATGAISTPIHQTASFRHPALGRSSGFDYSRTSNPTRLVLEQALAELDGGCRAFAFASGLAAIDAVVRLFAPGERIVVTEDLYGGTYRLFQHVYRPLGIEAVYVDTSDAAAVRAACADPRVRGLLVESPTNPVMRVADLRALAAIARERGLLFAVDNTFLTAWCQRPIEQGADLVLYSATKFLAGHNDVVAGAVVAATPALAERLAFLQNAAGAILGPQDSWLVLRGLKTLALRLERHQANAGRVADWLARHPRVRRVHYPGLEGHPGRDILLRDGSGFGGMVAFEVDDAARVPPILAGVRVFIFAESLGGVESLITHPLAQTHADLPREVCERVGINNRLLRLSVGIEDADDLIRDLEALL